MKEAMWAVRGPGWWDIFQGPYQGDRKLLFKNYNYDLKNKFPLNVKNTISSIRKEDLSIYTTFNLCQFLVDSTFNIVCTVALVGQTWHSPAVGRNK